MLTPPNHIDMLGPENNSTQLVKHSKQYLYCALFHDWDDTTWVAQFLTASYLSELGTAGSQGLSVARCSYRTGRSFTTAATGRSELPGSLGVVGCGLPSVVVYRAPTVRAVLAPGSLRASGDAPSVCVMMLRTMLQSRGP